MVLLGSEGRGGREGGGRGAWDGVRGGWLALGIGFIRGGFNPTLHRFGYENSLDILPARNCVSEEGEEKRRECEAKVRERVCVSD